MASGRAVQMQSVEGQKRPRGPRAGGAPSFGHPAELCENDLHRLLDFSMPVAYYVVAPSNV